MEHFSKLLLEKLNELLFNSFSESHFFFPSMANIVTVADLWNSIDTELILKLDSVKESSYWNFLLCEYVKENKRNTLVQYPKRIRDLLIMMLSLIHTPMILQSDYNEETMYQQSASHFYDAWVSNLNSSKDSENLIQLLFCDVKKCIVDCPSEYAEEPQQFLKALASVLLKNTCGIVDFNGLCNEKVEKICKPYELYATICSMNPHYAFLMCEINPLFPSHEINGQTLESIPFLPHFFNFQTIQSPVYQDGQLFFYRSTFSAHEIQIIKDYMNDIMSRIHKAQIQILHTFLTASYFSRDYILNLIAILIDCNRSRRVLSVGTLSSDGLMMNLSMCLCEVISTFLKKDPSPLIAKKFLSYVLSDLSRMDFINGNLSVDEKEHMCIVDLLNWLRPSNYVGRCKNDEKWWMIIRSQPDQVREIVDNDLQCKPASDLYSFMKSLASINDSIIFSSSLSYLKSLFDYSYNFFISGKRVSPVIPFSNEMLSCSKCKGSLQNSKYYRCICCNDYILCSSCYEQEKKQVIQEYTPPYSQAVLDLFNTIQTVSKMDSTHQPLTHFFTEVFHHPYQMNGRHAFHPVPSFTPLVPSSLSTTNDNETKEDETKEDETKEDDYEIWDESNPTLIEKYQETRCTCYSSQQCKKHGFVAAFSRKITKEAFPETTCIQKEEGFIHHCECFQCKTKPIIGTIYHCLHCSLQLCQCCYERDMIEGDGFPSHQCNHVYVLLYHPINPKSFLAHNRNDMRTIPNAVTLFNNELYMSGITLDQFLPIDSISNESHFQIEILALLIKLMSVNQTGLFQDYQFYNSSVLDFTSSLRSLQLSIGSMKHLYYRLCEHLSYILLSLLILYTPKNHPLSKKWNLQTIQVNKEIQLSSRILNEISDSKLCDIILLDMQPTPMFNVLSKSILEVIQYMFEWIMRVTTVTTMREEFEKGSFDYTILLLLCCLNENIIPNISTRLDILNTFYVLCTITHDKDDVEFLFGYPIIRHLLFPFSLKLFIDATSFRDSVKVRQIQMEINKIVALLIRSKTCAGEGYNECVQFFEGLGISHDLFPLYIEDVIRQTSNEQDLLNDIVAQHVHQFTQTHRIFAMNILENIKASVNLYVRLINNSITRNLLVSGYLLKRTIRFFLVILSSITKPTYVDDIPALTKFMNMNYDKWLSVIMDQVVSLIRYSPDVDSIDNSVQPSVAVSMDHDPHYKNAVLITIVEDDGFFDIKVFEWIEEYAAKKGLLQERKKSVFPDIVKKLKAYQKHFSLLNDAIADCPDEFLDSLMDTIMQDPVILPSGNRCDRSSIVRQLSISPIDPFTRAPLTMDMVIPDTELKERIHNYIRTRIEDLQNRQ